jgi:hypothetical protein
MIGSGWQYLFSRRLANPEDHEEAGVTLACLSTDNRQFQVPFREPTGEESAQVESLINSLDRIHRPDVKLMQQIYHQFVVHDTGKPFVTCCSIDNFRVLV